MTWTASDVLDTYADLLRRLRRPDANMASFTAFHMNRELRQKVKRIQFYPVVPAALGWAVTDQQGAEFANYLGTGLVGAPVYQVTEDMCEAIEAMFGKTVSEDPPIIYEANLPAAAGFVWLDKPLELQTSDGKPEQVQAVSWSRQNALTATGMMPALRIAIWTLASEAIRAGDIPAEPEAIADTQRRLGLVILLYSDIYLLDGPTTQKHGSVQPCSAVALVAYLNMLWMMLQMEITGIDRAPGTRGARRRALKEAGQSDVLVITLRRAARAGLARRVAATTRLNGRTSGLCRPTTGIASPRPARNGTRPSPLRTRNTARCAAPKCLTSRRTSRDRKARRCRCGGACTGWRANRYRVHGDGSRVGDRRARAACVPRGRRLSQEPRRPRRAGWGPALCSARMHPRPDSLLSL